MIDMNLLRTTKVRCSVATAAMTRYGARVVFEQTDYDRNMTWYVIFGTGVVFDGPDLQTVMERARDYAESFRALADKYPPLPGDDEWKLIKTHVGSRSAKNVAASYSKSTATSTPTTSGGSATKPT